MVLDEKFLAKRLGPIVEKRSFLEWRAQHPSAPEELINLWLEYAHLDDGQAIQASQRIGDLIEEAMILVRP